MKSWLLYLVPLLASLSLSIPVMKTDLPRLVIYFQTTHDSENRPISMLPLINEQGIALTHLIVCSFHINRDSVIHLNDYPPSDPRFYTLWNETVLMKDAGVTVMGMIGGAAPGSFDNKTLDGDEATFERYYEQLKEVIQEYSLQGLDVDVEQPMSQQGISRLVNRLHQDFGSDFLVTMAPVATALKNGGSLSGFNYTTLQEDHGSDIAFYNTQFYNGFGSLKSTRDFDNIVSAGWNPSAIVAGQLTAPEGRAGSFAPFSDLNATIIALRDAYGQIGGIMGWEYFNSQPGGTRVPWEWAQIVTEILRPDEVPDLRITPSDAERLQKAYMSSWMLTEEYRNEGGAPLVDYLSMVKPGN